MYKHKLWKTITQSCRLDMHTQCYGHNHNKHSSFLYRMLSDSGHTRTLERKQNTPAAANLYCAVVMSCHYLAVIIPQAQDHTASLDPSEGVVAPPPVCLQGLGNGIENKQTWLISGNSQSETDLETLQLAETMNCYNTVTVMM